MFKSIKRKLLKNKKSTKQKRDCVDLDSVAASLEFQKDIGMVFDPKKKEEYSRILNYFFIVGPVAKSERSSDSSIDYEPGLLLTYPTHKFPFSKSDFERVIQFCYPEGFENLNSKFYKKPTKSSKPKSSDRSQREKFVFGLNDGGVLNFCVVTRFYSKLFEYLSTDDYPICFVSVTSSTLLTTHFTIHKFLHFIVKNNRITDSWETYLRTNSITIKNKKDYGKDESDSDPISPFVNAEETEEVNLDDDDDTLQLLDKNLLREDFLSDQNRIATLKTFFENDFGMNLMSTNPLFAIREGESPYKFEEISDKNFFRVIETLFCFQLLENRHQQITLRLRGEKGDLNLIIEIPKLSDQLFQIGRFSFGSLFNHLSVKDVARFYRAGLLEQQILVIGGSVSMLTRCSLSILSMVAPMSPKFSILPVIPNDSGFMEYIGTPTPFVFGALDTELLRGYLARNPSSITIVDLTAGCVDYPDDVLHVPHVDVLKTRLKDALRGAYKPPLTTAELFGEATSTTSITSITVRKKARISYFLNQDENSEQTKEEDSMDNLNSMGLAKPQRNSEPLPVQHLKLNTSFGGSLESGKIGNTNNQPEFSQDSLSRIFILFNEYFVSQERLKGCRVRDTTDEDNPVIGFVKDAYMVNVEDNEVDFYDALVETQTFQSYCEETYHAPS